VYRYADEIFTLGQELVDVLRGHPQGSAIQLVVGIRIAMPKLMTLRLLEPALNLSTDLKLICIEDSLDRLLDMLAVHRVDIILSDCPVPSSAGVRFHNHLLSESATGLFATQKVAKQCRRDFPRSLNGVPFLLPVSESNQRKSIDLWLINNDIQPFIRGEFSDSALLKAAGRTGEGVFPGTVQIRDEICRQYECEFISEMAGVVERFYVISTERKNSHPAIAAITKTAMRIE
ncbi:MAG: LysR family transcriptional regulator, partial [Planctomycetes bacterium]|nr:LysR family transcriptional regulator [Planctomycetota bacterium]